MANHHRGEVHLTLNGRDMPMRLTLQSLAEIEAAFGGGLEEIGTRFAAGKPRSADLIILLGAALRGGGATLSDREIAAELPAERIGEVAERLACLLERTFGGIEAPNPPMPQKA
jgi:hypothetical protein